MRDLLHAHSLRMNSRVVVSIAGGMVSADIVLYPDKNRIEMLVAVFRRDFDIYESRHIAILQYEGARCRTFSAVTDVFCGCVFRFRRK